MNLNVIETDTQGKVYIFDKPTPFNPETEPFLFGYKRGLEESTNRILALEKHITNYRKNGYSDNDCREYCHQLKEAESNSKFQKLQDELGEWADATFGPRTPESLLNHLIEEVGEVKEALNDESEWADCLTLLIDSYRLATGKNTNDLLDACFAKIEINKQRTWNAPDENGVTRHVK